MRGRVARALRRWPPNRSAAWSQARRRAPRVGSAACGGGAAEGLLKGVGGRGAAPARRRGASAELRRAWALRTGFGAQPPRAPPKQHVVDVHRVRPAHLGRGLAPGRAVRPRVVAVAAAAQRLPRGQVGRARQRTRGHTATPAAARCRVPRREQRRSRPRSSAAQRRAHREEGGAGVAVRVRRIPHHHAFRRGAPVQHHALPLHAAPGQARRARPGRPAAAGEARAPRRRMKPGVRHLGQGCLARLPGEARRPAGTRRDGASSVG